MKLGKVYFKLWVRVCYLYNKYILALRRDPKLRKMSMTIMVLTSPYILARWLVLACLDWLCVPLVRRANRLEQAKAFAHELAVVVIAKNEGRYIREWVEYHKLLGVTKFYFYDNDSEDNTREILRPYVDSGLVNYRFLSGKARQLDAYNDALVRHKDECRYMAFIDMDEFIVPTTPWKPIVEVVKEIIGNSGGGASGVGINWALFGSSGLAETPRGGGN